MKLIRKFIEDKSGNFVMIGALSMVPIMAATAAATDFSYYSRNKSDMQQALDAAALATSKELSSNASESHLEPYSYTFFQANLDDGIDINRIVYDFDLIEGDGSVEPAIPTTVKVCAEYTYDTYFGPVIGMDEIVTDLCSEITVGSRTVEIALVMDNSGSMGTNSRLSTMKTETKRLVTSIFNAGNLSAKEDPVKFSVVPFASMVNIGSNNANQNWMDTKGWASYHHENFDWNTYQTTRDTRFQDGGFQEKDSNGNWQWMTRHDVYEKLEESTGRSVSWDGCVEMRPWPYNVTDDSASSNDSYSSLLNSKDGDGDGVNDGVDQLFVPTFAPDTPDRTYYQKSGNSYYRYYDSDYYYNNYINEWYTQSQARFGYNSQPTSSELNKFAGFNHSNSYSFDPNRKGNTDQVDRMRWMFKYQNDVEYGSFHSGRGPNYGCTTSPLTELTDDPDIIEDAIDAMDDDGTTNLQQGLTWGWRTLSDDEPFTDGRADDHKDNMKYIIFLTDGNNYYGRDYGDTPLLTNYGAWGFAMDADTNASGDEWKAQNRWIKGLETADIANTIYAGESFDTTPESNSDSEKIMNAHTAQACENIKADGITVFTIAFDVSSGSSVKSLLEACSGSGVKNGNDVVANGQFYFDVNAGQLDDAMNAISAQIADMRIIR